MEDAVRGRYDWVSEFHEGRASVELDGKYGVIDADGKVVVTLIYEWVGDYKEGRASIRLNGKRGFVDLNGNVVVPPRYDWVGGFSQKMAIVRLNWKWGFIDLDGNEVIPCWYERIQKQSYGFMATLRVSVHSFEHLYYDSDGHQIAEPVNN
jgi:hypothetical protein